MHVGADRGDGENREEEEEQVDGRGSPVAALGGHDRQAQSSFPQRPWPEADCMARADEQLTMHPASYVWRTARQLSNAMECDARVVLRILISRKRPLNFIRITSILLLLRLLMMMMMMMMMMMLMLLLSHVVVASWPR